MLAQEKICLSHVKDPSMSKTVDVVAGNWIGPKNAEKPLAGAARCCAERERPLPRPVHVGPHGFRVDHPHQQGRHVVGHADVRGAVCSRRTISRYRLTSVQKICRSPRRSHFSDGRWLRPDGSSLVARSQLPAEPACQSCWLLFLKDFSSSL